MQEYIQSLLQNVLTIRKPNFVHIKNETCEQGTLILRKQFSADGC